MRISEGAPGSAPHYLRSIAGEKLRQLWGIHLDRRVVYLDNSTHKLTSYADAWFTPSIADVVRPATSPAEAEEIARQW